MCKDDIYGIGGVELGIHAKTRYYPCAERSVHSALYWLASVTFLICYHTSSTFSDVVEKRNRKIYHNMKWLKWSTA